MNTSHKIIELNLDSLFADTETSATNAEFSSFNLNSLLYTNKTPQTAGGFFGLSKTTSQSKTSSQSSPAIQTSSQSSAASQKAAPIAIDSIKRYNDEIMAQRPNKMQLLNGIVHITSAQSDCLESTFTKEKSIPVKFIELMRNQINTIKNDQNNPENETVIKTLEIMADHIFIILASMKEIRCDKPSSQGGNRKNDVSFGVGYKPN